MATTQRDKTGIRRENGRADKRDPGLVTLFLAGDVMTGRGVDQVLPRPCTPVLHEHYVTSARDYVALAERANGPIGRPVAYDYVWGDALAELERREPSLRLVNLETAVTTSPDAEPKGINYRMNPENVAVLAAAKVDCCVLANNHVLDWGRPGLVETLDTLAAAGIGCVGAGRSLREAMRPAVLPVPGGRVIVLACASPTSGVPRSWAATPDQPGINLVHDFGDAAVDSLAVAVAATKMSGDVVVASIHWGANWGHDIPREQTRFARALIDRAGVDVVFGHSSHHPKAIEVHHGRLILYGCGDFIDDYEGIRGHEEHRGDLVLMYFPALRQSDGSLDRLTMVPLKIRNMRLNRASRQDAEWIRNVLARESARFGTSVRLDGDVTLALEWPGDP